MNIPKTVLTKSIIVGTIAVKDVTPSCTVSGILDHLNNFMTAWNTPKSCSITASNMYAPRVYNTISPAKLLGVPIRPSTNEINDIIYSLSVTDNTV